MKLTAEIIQAAEDLGKQKMVLQAKERCGYPGAREEEKQALQEYRRRLEILRILLEDQE
jgi:hypothetical protein